MAMNVRLVQVEFSVVLVPGLLRDYGNSRLRVGERYDLYQTEVVAVGETRTWASKGNMTTL